jgi:hypothetical protein
VACLTDNENPRLRRTPLAGLGRERDMTIVAGTGKKSQLEL